MPRTRSFAAFNIPGAAAAAAVSPRRSGPRRGWRAACAGEQNSRCAAFATKGATGTACDLPRAARALEDNGMKKSRSKPAKTVVDVGSPMARQSAPLLTPADLKPAARGTPLRQRTACWLM